MTTDAAFPDPLGLGADLFARVRFVNINRDRNRALLERCKPLNGCALFIELARELSDILGDFARGIAKALELLPDDNVLKPYLLQNKAEVTMRCLCDFDEELYWNALRDDFLAEGRE